MVMKETMEELRYSHYDAGVKHLKTNQGSSSKLTEERQGAPMPSPRER
jgi:hypothetical protein